MAPLPDQLADHRLRRAARIDVGGVDEVDAVLAGVLDDAPRLAQVRPDAALLGSYYAQLADVLAELARHGLVHGDLSAYNVLAAGERLVVIDLPQLVDLVANPAGPDFLLRDCTNVCRWFRARGLDVDEHLLFGEVMAHAF